MARASWRCRCARMCRRRSRRATTRSRCVARRRRRQSPRRKSEPQVRAREKGPAEVHRAEPKEPAPRTKRAQGSEARDGGDARAQHASPLAGRWPPASDKAAGGDDRLRGLRSARRRAARGGGRFDNLHGGAGPRDLPLAAARRRAQRQRAAVVLRPREARGEDDPRRLRRRGAFRRRPQAAREEGRARGGSSTSRKTRRSTNRSPRRSAARRWSIRPRSGGRSSTTPGGSSAISSTTRACTAWIGRRSASITAKLLDDAVTRSDVNYILGEMLGELNASHAYRSGGDLEEGADPRGRLSRLRFRARGGRVSHQAHPRRPRRGTMCARRCASRRST